MLADRYRSCQGRQGNVKERANRQGNRNRAGGQALCAHQHSPSCSLWRWGHPWRLIHPQPSLHSGRYCFKVILVPLPCPILHCHPPLSTPIPTTSNPHPAYAQGVTASKLGVHHDNMSISHLKIDEPPSCHSRLPSPFLFSCSKCTYRHVQDRLLL